MNVIILLDDGALNVNENTNDPDTRRYANVLFAMGYEITYIKSHTTSPVTVAEMELHVTRLSAVAVFVPYLNSSNRLALKDITVAGLTVPVVAKAGNYFHTSAVKGITGYYGSDANDTYGKADIVPLLDSGEDSEVRSIGKRFVLDTDGTALIQGQDSELTAISAWSWESGGGNKVYWENAGSAVTQLPILIQAAIDDGVLVAPSLTAPVLLNIDHVNQAPAQAYSEMIVTLGNILRSMNGVCYASLEHISVSSMPAELTANLVNYADVFRYVTTHDHHPTYFPTSGVGNWTIGSGANTAVDDQQLKSEIQDSYDGTKAAIESLGLVADTNFAHFGENRVGTRGWEVLEAAGFKAARLGAGTVYDNSFTYPSLPALGLHWLKKVTTFRGIRMLGASVDAGDDGGNEIDLAKDYAAYRRIFQSLSENTIFYHHSEDFELPTGVTDGVELTRGTLTYQYGAILQSYCKDCLNVGADINDYL